MATGIDRNAGRIRDMFAAISGTYDALNHGLSLNRDRAWRRRAVAAARSNGPERALDVCAGTADLSIELVEGLPDGSAVVGSDFCEPMLRLGAEKATLGSLDLPLVAADAMHLPFADRAFTLATVAFGIRNVADRVAGLREMHRVLDDGGRLVVLEFNRPRNPVFRILYETYFLVILPIVGNLVSGGKHNAYGYLPRSVQTFPSPAAFVSMMEEIGFRDVRTETLDFGIATLWIGTK